MMRCRSITPTHLASIASIEMAGSVKAPSA